MWTVEFICVRVYYIKQKMSSMSIDGIRKNMEVANIWSIETIQIERERREHPESGEWEMGCTSREIRKDNALLFGRIQGIQVWFGAEVIKDISIDIRCGQSGEVRDDAFVGVEGDSGDDEGGM